MKAAAGCSEVFNLFLLSVNQTPDGFDLFCVAGVKRAQICFCVSCRLRGFVLKRRSPVEALTGCVIRGGRGSGND